MKSHEFLQSAIDVQAERGKQYDKPTGERSMGATISAFNCITGYTLEESDGWMLLSLLKLVRQAQNPEQYHHDSALDFVAYASLYAEAASEQCGQKEEFDARSMPIIELKANAIGPWKWAVGDTLMYNDSSSDFYTSGERYKILSVRDGYMYLEDDTESNKHGWTLSAALDSFMTSK
jgi:hypothetical protein